MLDLSNTIDGTAVCGMCGDPLPQNRYVQMDGAFLNNYCSEDCLREAVREQRGERWEARRRTTGRLAIVAVFVGAYLTPHQGPQRFAPPPPVKAAPASAAVDTGPLSLPEGWFGPVWPPTDLSVLAVLGRDAWVHPLSGPVRRMPTADARCFGAGRPGDRPSECRNGHCGVDLGGEIWGEHIRAVHDGVVEFVQRGANPTRGGRFVRIAHHNGTVITQYFHLAAIPRGLERGKLVRGGEIVGLLGDSGVTHSAPHLHFSISIRPGKDWPEKYMDPEPLIALWPLRVPVDGSEVGLVTLVAQPGVPIGSVPLTSGRQRKAAKQKRGRAESSKGEKGRSAKKEEAPAEDEAPTETVEPEAPTDD